MASSLPSLPVVRVKRRINEEPLSAFVLNCKKPKLDESSGGGGAAAAEETKDEISTILKFAGTVENQNSPIGEHIHRLTKDEAKQLAQKTRVPNVTEKSRQEMRHSLQESRFKVVNCHRTLEQPNGETMECPKEITIVDIEKQQNQLEEVAASASTQIDNDDDIVTLPQIHHHTTTSHVPTDGDGGGDADGFVYDLYVPDHDQQLPDNVDYMEQYLRFVYHVDQIYLTNRRYI